MNVLPDTAAVAEFMRAFGQPVRTTPTADITDEERLLRARLVVEEALEFAAAMGCTVQADPDGRLDAKATVVSLDPDAAIDLVEAADAIADLTVVTKGSAHTLGIPCDRVFVTVHDSNMRKLGPDGRPILRESDGKVIKPAGWRPPTEDIRWILSNPGASLDTGA